MTKVADINDEVRASLTEAGIGPIYHERGLLSDARYGAGMLKYLTANGDRIRRVGHSIMFHGVGLTEIIKLFCRGLHINGVGCFIRPLVQMRGIINDPEFREVVEEIDVLVILNAQDMNRGSPLHDSVISELEYVIQKRCEAKLATFIQMAIPETQSIDDLPNCYWSFDFLDDVTKKFDRLTPTMISLLGRRDAEAG